MMHTAWRLDWECQHSCCASDFMRNRTLCSNFSFFACQLTLPGTPWSHFAVLCGTLCSPFLHPPGNNPGLLSSKNLTTVLPATDIEEHASFTKSLLNTSVFLIYSVKIPLLKMKISTSLSGKALDQCPFLCREISDIQEKTTTLSNDRIWK